MKNFKLTAISFITALLVLAGFNTRADATVATVTLTLIDSPTTLSNGRAYFLAGRDYRFRVQATSLNNTLITNWTSFTLTIAGGAASCTVNIQTSGVTASSNLTGISVTNNTTVYSNIDFTVSVRFTWSNAADFAQTSSTIVASVTDTAPSTVTDSVTATFGLSTMIDAYNLKMNGVAADSRVNRYHSAFTVTADQVIYYVQDTVKTGSSDRVYTYATNGAAEIGTITLLINGTASGFTDADETDGLTFSITSAYFSTNGDKYLRIRCAMATGGVDVDQGTALQMTLNVNTISIGSISFYNGGGVNSPYYRSVNLPGTMVSITADLEDHTAASLGGVYTMRGDTTITITDTTDSITFTVQILSGAVTGTAVVTVPGTVASGSTIPHTYRITSISGSAYDSEQNIAGRVNQPANPIIYWDNNDPPGNNSAPFTPWVGYSVTATNFTMNWTAVSTLGLNDGDFYSYRIYYKLNSASTWTMIDRSVSGYGPSQTYDLSLSSTASATITSLIPFTKYDFYITAVDVFGQEVVTANATPASSTTIVTNPSSIDITLTDGITTYSTFGTANAGDRPVRKSAIRVDIYWVSTSGQPDSVNIVFNSLTDAALTASGVISGTEGTNYDRVNCPKSAANTYTGYIPSGNRYMVLGNDIKFIVESVKSGIKTYADQNYTDGDPNNLPWTFYVSISTNFTPWPTRVLNNVITDKDPVAYPSYYLSDDAYVTIKAYDIKGRIVNTLLDSGFRKAGQNIKENGWRGVNMNGQKIGIGLYYIHIKAERVSDGKVIIDKFCKVVMNR